MKKIIYTALCLMTGLAAHSQYYYLPDINAGINPGQLNADGEYPVGGGLPAGWITILPGGNTTSAWSPSQTIPFSFQFNGATETSYKVSSSGILTFDVATGMTAPSSTRAALPSASIPDKSVCIWGMYGAGANDNIITKTFGTAPNRQHWIQFSSYGYGSTISDGSNFTYWSIVLEETTNKIYIVDNRTGGFTGVAKVSLGVQIDGSTATSVAGSPDVNTEAGTDGTPADNTYYTFIQGTQPGLDMAGVSISNNPFVGPGNMNFAGTLKNNGTTAITSMSINYSVDGGAAVSAPLTGLNIASLATYNFTHPTAWNATTGNHTVKVWASNLNGSSDQNNANDTITQSVSVVAELVQRVPFYEIFTSSTCGPCTPGNINFLGITDTISRADYVAIKYQQDFPSTGDPYRTVESTDRRNTPYAINSIPRMEIDGGWDGNAQSFTYGMHQASRNTPAFFKIEGEYARNAKQYDVKVKYSPLVQASGAKIYVAVIEHETKLNVKTNGETEFIDVMKKMLPSPTGTAVSNVAVGAWDSLSLSYTFNGNYRLPSNGQVAHIIDHTLEHSVENFYNTSVIAWIQTPDKQVMQAARLTATENTGGLIDNANMKDVTIAPNPANDAFTVSFDSKNAGQMTFVLVDAMGSVVYSNVVNSNTGVNSFAIPTATLSNGIYHVMMFDAANNSHVEKVMVQH